ncbi:MAG: pilin [Patescibacteria group bacterium]
MKKMFLFLFLIAGFLAPLSVGAQEGCGVPPYFNYIFNFGLGASGILAITMIVLGAVQMMLNAANPSAQTAGKDKIKSALMGLALIFGSWLILYTINPDLVNFSQAFNSVCNDPIQLPSGGGPVGSPFQGGGGRSGGGGATGSW